MTTAITLILLCVACALAFYIGRSSRSSVIQSVYVPLVAKHYGISAGEAFERMYGVGAALVTSHIRSGIKLTVECQCGCGKTTVLDLDTLMRLEFPRGDG